MLFKLFFGRKFHEAFGLLWVKNWTDGHTHVHDQVEAVIKSAKADYDKAYRNLSEAKDKKIQPHSKWPSLTNQDLLKNTLAASAVTKAARKKLRELANLAAKAGYASAAIRAGYNYPSRGGGYGSKRKRLSLKR